MKDLDLVAEPVRSLLARLPSDSHSGVRERTESEIRQFDDYLVQWEISSTPTNAAACPIQLYAAWGWSGERAWGFAFDTRGRLAAHLNLKVGQRTRDLVAFGTEPIQVPATRVISIIEAVVAGNVTLQYRALAGWLMSTSGVTNLAEPQRFYGTGVPLGRHKTFRYAPWSQAA